MDMCGEYQTRVEEYGTTKRERALNHTQHFLSDKLRGSLSCKDVLIGDKKRTVIILNRREDMSLKKICAIPGETLPHGELVDFADSKWLITELDANDEVYASGLMKRCNYPLRWLSKTGEMIEKWCVVEDGTKYLIGERSEDIITVGDARLAITIGKDNDTIELGRGNRFLIDDMDSNTIHAYRISKLNKLFNVYNGNGVFRFILTEENMTDNDNKELRIADYYSWKPYEKLDNEHIDEDRSIEDIVENALDKEKPDDDKGVWI